jgi:hypothetical protein
MRGLLLLAPLPLAAHMVSMSTGDIRVDGARAEYELAMPLYEVQHVRDPEGSLFESVRFRGGGGEARLTARKCREDRPAGAYVCNASYEFPGVVEDLEVESRLHSITVPNHVHLLRARLGGKSDQAVLDLSFPFATLRFHPPSSFEVAVSQIGAGMLRAAGAAQLLFLFAVALAARGRKELLALAGAFLLGQALACLVTPLSGWRPAPRFIEAAAALSIAYLAVEILLLPSAGKRWLVVGVLGLFHGLYLDLFLRTGEFQAGYVLAGASSAEAALLALFALGVGRIKNAAERMRPVPVAATVLLLIGMTWFVMRLRS